MQVVERVAPNAIAAATEVLPDRHDRLGPLVSRHFAKARDTHVLGALAGLVLGSLLLLWGLLTSALTRQLEVGVWLGPAVIAGAAWVLSTERREAKQALGVYQYGFLSRQGTRSFALLWTEVAHVKALTDSDGFSMEVTTTGGRMHVMTERIQGLRAIVSIFQNRG